MIDTAGGNRVGIDLGGTKIAGILMDAGGAVLTEARCATPQMDYPGTLEAVAEIAEQLDPAGVCPVGIGTPGSVIAASGLMHNCNSTCLNGRPLLADLNVRLSRRVRLANDADCFALSEAIDGSGADADSVFGVILGTGVGGGLVLKGGLVTGAGGLTGEWGHNSTPFDRLNSPDQLKSRIPSRQCYCGQLNCIESYLSGPGFSRTHEDLWSQRANPETIYKQAVDDAPEALSALLAVALRRSDWRWLDSANTAAKRAQGSLAVYCTMLVSALAGVVNLLDPDVIVFGGGLSNMLAVYQPVEDALHEQVFGGRGTTRLAPPRYGDASGVRGAAWLWDAPS